MSIEPSTLFVHPNPCLPCNPVQPEAAAKPFTVNDFMKIAESSRRESQLKMQQERETDMRRFRSLLSLPPS